MQELSIEGFPLSPQQKRLWPLQLLVPQTYQAECLVLIEGALDVAALRLALNQVVERYEILRTSFQSLPGMSLPLQVVSQDLDRETHLRTVLTELETGKYSLRLSLPALCCDRRGLQNLVQEIGYSYERIMRGESLPLDEPLQYADISEWQNKLLETESAEAGKEYWRKQDRSHLETLKLPYERNEMTTAFVPRFVRTQIVAEQLELITQQQKISVSAMLLTCWLTLLYRLTAQAHIFAAVACDGRNYPGLETALGLFTRYLPLSVEVDASTTFAELLARVDEAANEAIEYQEYFAENNFIATQKTIFPFSYEYEDRRQRLRFSDLTFDISEQQVCTERFQVRLTCFRTAHGIVAEFHYDPDLYSETDISRLAAEFQTLVSSACERPTAAISDLEILGPAEKEQLLVSWNDTTVSDPHNESVLTLFETHAVQTPDAVAVVYRGQSLSYAELNARANRVAHQLQWLGVSAEVPVGLCMERSLELVIGLLGILKAGGAYVPLDPTYPRERLRFMLEDTKAAVLLTKQYLVDQLPPHQAQCVCLDRQWHGMMQASSQNPKRVIHGNNLAYIIYTSGSTGAPKGVCVSHRNLLQSTRARLIYYPAYSARFLLLSSFAFDSSIAGIFWTLCTGGTLVLPEEEIQNDAIALVHLIEKLRISHLLSLPSLYTLILEAASPGKSGEPGDLDTLQTVIVAGEACAPATVQLHYTTLAKTTLYNEYGPTEATVWSSVYQCAVPEGNVVPIGRPIANARLYILDKRLQPVPIGVSGELYVAGEGVTRGYLNRSAVTAERFLPDPFSTEEGARLYRTGDLARYLANGNIQFLGRVDNQVKLRGYRIELGEIEAVLREHAAVRESVVIASDDQVGGKRLVGYLVLDEQRGLTARQLLRYKREGLLARLSSTSCKAAWSSPAVVIGEVRELLQQRLPEHMIPGALVLLEALPLMPNGKVDRQALPAPELEAESERSLPRTPVEEVLASIWSEVLGVAELSVTANFFELGGHSLLATQVMSRIRKTFNIELPVRSLFSNPTVRALAAAIAAASGGPCEMEAMPITRASREGDLPLSYAQQRLWFGDQLMPHSALYNVAAAVRLKGSLDCSALRETLAEITRRHEVLRTTFPARHGQPLQLIAPPGERELVVTDLSDIEDEEKRESAARSLAQSEATLPFDLAAGPLMRTSLLRLDNEDHMVLLTMHHIIADAWSMGLLLREVSALYPAYNCGESSPLTELPIQYADYAVWQRDWLTGEVLEKQLGYWQKQLQGAPEVLYLPTDKVRPAAPSFRGEQHPFTLPAELIERLRQLSRGQSVTLFMTLLAAFQIQLHYCTQQDEILVGTNVANRNRADTEALIGFFVNTVALRGDLSGDPSFLELLKRVRDVCLMAYAHQDLPFEKLVAVLQPKRDRSRSPLFQVKIEFGNDLTKEFALPGVQASPIKIGGQVVRYDLHLFFTEHESAITGQMVYASDLFELKTIARMTRQLTTLLSEIVATPNARLSELEERLEAAEREYQSGRERKAKEARLTRYKEVKRKEVSA